MTFTPQPAGTPGGGVSLLFTPASQRGGGLGGEGGKPTPGEFRGMPSFGRSPGHGRKEPTSTRRRSLTPASQPKDTPPPPPGDSLLDSPVGLAPAPWGTPRLEDGVEDMSISPLGGGAVQQPAPAAAAPAPVSRELVQGGGLSAYEDTWVTVYGFRSQADLPLVLKEFGRCGDIVQFGTFGDVPGANWVHIQYANKYGAQRALLRSGEQLSGQVMVGVKPLDPQHRAAVERAPGGAAGGAPGGGLAMAVPKPAAAAAQRPYAVGGGGGAAAVVPLPSKGLMAKLQEFVLGL